MSDIEDADFSQATGHDSFCTSWWSVRIGFSSMQWSDRRTHSWHRKRTWWIFLQMFAQGSCWCCSSSYLTKYVMIKCDHCSSSMICSHWFYRWFQRSEQLRSSWKNISFSHGWDVSQASQCGHFLLWRCQIDRWVRQILSRQTCVACNCVTFGRYATNSFFRHYRSLPQSFLWWKRWLNRTSGC